MISDLCKSGDRFKINIWLSFARERVLIEQVLQEATFKLLIFISKLAESWQINCKTKRQTLDHLLAEIAADINV